nr:hypothetical protein DLTAUQXX_DLTAUQXX_CDS_0005 [uncultured phage]CAI9750030.1 hypothetical protein LUIDIZRK_LUIDIZRK_CDS_0005 [uncultured phage]
MEQHQEDLTRPVQTVREFGTVFEERLGIS